MQSLAPLPDRDSLTDHTTQHSLNTFLSLFFFWCFFCFFSFFGNNEGKQKPRKISRSLDLLANLFHFCFRFPLVLLPLPLPLPLSSILIGEAKRVRGGFEILLGCQLNRYVSNVIVSAEVVTSLLKLSKFLDDCSATERCSAVVRMEGRRRCRRGQRKKRDLQRHFPYWTKFSCLKPWQQARLQV